MYLEEAVAILIVVQIIGAIVSYLVFKREALGIIGEVAEILTSIFEKPTVKGAMSVLGKKSGEVRHDQARSDKLAMQILSSPKISGIKMIAKQTLGIDIDEMIQEEGPSDTLSSIIELGRMMGIDVMSLISENLSGSGSSSSSQDSPYL